MRKKHSTIIPIFLSIILLISGCGQADHPAESFSGESALLFIEEQMSFGPRIPGSEGHKNERQWIQQSLKEFGWDVETQTSEYKGVPIYNFTASRPAQLDAERILIGAHYDTRILADNSAGVIDQGKPVMGANDGASGVAVLMELARVLPKYNHLDINLVFFDAEDNGDIEGREWIVGSTHYAADLTEMPNIVVIIDMIGDSQQEIFFEKYSDEKLREEIWEVASQKGINSFIHEEKSHIYDDHIPFLRLGIPSVLLIDFDYPYWHTTEDTLDKVSATSLENVGQVLQDWLIWRDKGAE